MSIPTAAAADGDFTYIDSGGSGRIVAYQNDTGQPVWSRPLPGNHSLDFIYSNGTEVSASGTPAHFYVVSAKSGDILEDEAYPEARPIYAKWGSMPARSPTLRSLQATDARTGNVLWQATFREAVAAPVFSERYLLVRTGKWVGRVTALDPDSGAVLWETSDNVISNVAIAGSAVYYITMDGNLIAADASRGVELGHISFGPDVPVVYEHGHYFGYHVAATQSSVIAYMGDSAQLFAYKITP